MSTDKITPEKIEQSTQDPFFSVSNMQQLEKADKQIKNGQTISKTMAELEKMENEPPSKTEKQKVFEELMREEYDFSDAIPNPYAHELKKPIPTTISEENTILSQDIEKQPTETSRQTPVQ